jgi:dihydrofolate reductase
VAEYWPNHGQVAGPEGEPDDSSDKFSSFINAVPKYVVSNSIAKATWDNTAVVSGDVGGQLRKLKEQVDGEITMAGSATLVRCLLAEGLLDGLHLMVHPIAVGPGERLFADTSTYPVQLLSDDTFETGVLNLTYAPARS